jgi:hypothetical protein
MAKQRVEDFWYLGDLFRCELSSHSSLSRAPTFYAATNELHRVAVVTMS